MTENSAIFNARHDAGSFRPHRQPAPTAQDCLKRGNGANWRTTRQLSGECRIEILEAVEAIAAIAEHLAGLAHIAKLPGELQQAHLSFDNLLVLRHRRCPHKKPRPGAP